MENSRIHNFVSSCVSGQFRLLKDLLLLVFFVFVVITLIYVGLFHIFKSFGGLLYYVVIQCFLYSEPIEFLFNVTKTRHIIETPPEPIPFYYVYWKLLDEGMTHYGLARYAYWATFLIPLYFSYRLITSSRFIRRMIYRVKGVYVGESLIEGSKFVSGRIPSCQVEILSGGIFANTFVGYAFRISETILAMPLHVYNQARPDIMVSKGDFSVDITQAPMKEADSVSDLCYVSLEPRIFSQLSASIAKFPSGGVEQFVQISGKQGVSNGSLKKCSTSGLMEYSGSTYPGYSGAPYMVGSLVYGMHLGSSITVNIGVSHLVLQYDLRSLFAMTPVDYEGSWTYTSPPMLEGGDEDLMYRKKGWDEDRYTRVALAKDNLKPRLQMRDVMKPISRAANLQDSWAEEVEEAFGDFVSEASIQDIEFLEDWLNRRKEKLRVTRPVLIKGQGMEEELVEITSQPPVKSAVKVVEKCEFKEPETFREVHVLMKCMDDKIHDLEHQVEVLRDTVNGMSKLIQKDKDKQQAKMVQREMYHCTEEQCGKRYPTFFGILAHLKDGHQKTEEDILDMTKNSIIQKTMTYVPEGLLSDNTSDLVGNGLGFSKPSPSQRRKAHRLRKALRDSRQNNASQSSGQNPKNTASSNQILQTILDRLDKNSAGQGLVKSQS